MNEKLDVNKLVQDFVEKFWTECGSKPEGGELINILSVGFLVKTASTEAGIEVTWKPYEGTATDPTTLPTEYRGWKVVYMRGEAFELLAEEEGVWDPERVLELQREFGKEYRGKVGRLEGCDGDVFKPFAFFSCDGSKDAVTDRYGLRRGEIALIVDLLETETDGTPRVVFPQRYHGLKVCYFVDHKLVTVGKEEPPDAKA